MDLFLFLPFRGGMYITTGPEYWEDEDRYRGILYRGHIISPISCPLFPPFSMVSLLMCRGRRGPISFCPIRLVHHVLLPFQFQIKLGSNHCYGQKEKKKEKKGLRKFCEYMVSGVHTGQWY